jgi:hypothetical protein
MAGQGFVDHRLCSDGKNSNSLRVIDPRARSLERTMIVCAKSIRHN